MVVSFFNLLQNSLNDSVYKRLMYDIQYRCYYYLLQFKAANTVNPVET